MSEKYLGILKSDDPLFFYLNKIKELKLHNFVPVDFYLVQSFSNMKTNVYKYTSNFDGTSFVVKFFGKNSTVNKKIAIKRLLWEFNKLKFFQSCSNKKTKVINPYCYLPDIDCALVEPYINGKTLDYYIKSAIEKNEKNKLYKRLELLALLFSCIHKKVNQDNYDMIVEKNYCSKILHTLYKNSLIDKNKMLSIKEKCIKKFSEIRHNTTHIHGDATTTNFIYANGSIYAIDMEKAKIASLELDLGFIVAELKHHFMLFGQKDNDASEYISFFLNNYCLLSSRNINDIENNLEIFISLGLFRIARNMYLDANYRKLLVKKAIDLIQ
ncbi:MAG: hypothetical protein ACPLW6_05525 [Desulfurella sp.]|jgi:tRNA A-37 threonylcarbamoyl transferase component Bud32|uniref:Phosphotransferase enzyme family protein n=1 Tax=Desulfurella multipotens TaxID=79269 RepID=A0A1G6R373_9BACT|nr:MULTISPECIES: hypothetical protein [Desulfurella]AHF98016.1 hypothetical protein DESACE_06045 [Desulfurella acetivorans A63]HEX13920.1 hypothetical protein [Desulfurella acetivorans]PMP63544.1 MAG: hypothetical protein C0192_07480 [Desulfurella multipotens]PMP92294.1 MAG: hypothetical protein C0173_02405 [Desulfurella sp.]SDC98515.1 hypothetical protein SAMN05660835_01710 [Desulfurella multipotens]